MNATKKLLTATLALGAGFASAVTVPTVSDVTLEQTGTHKMTISYKLNDGPAVITLDIQTNFVNEAEETCWVSIGGEHIQRVSFGSDVFKTVTGDTTHTIRWEADLNWPGHLIENGGIRAVVTAWALDNKPDYMVVDLANPSVGGEFYYPGEEWLPGGLLENAAYRRSKLVMRKIDAKDVKWTMGAYGESGRNKDSEALHDVTLTNNYYIGVFEVTKAQYSMFVKDQWGNPQFNSYFTGDNDRAKLMRPVERFELSTFRGCSFWHDTPSAASFLGMIRTATGLDLDVPSEAQWEYACRAGYGENTWGNGERFNDDLSNIPGRYAGNSDKDNLSQYEIPDTYNPHNAAPDDKGTAIVGSYAPNAWGLYDMHGNVAEWCQDFLNCNWDPQGAVCETVPGTNYRVHRGGSYRSAATECRSASRGWANYTWKNEACGFRLSCQAGLK